jgi:hypothetical protein
MRGVILTTLLWILAAASAAAAAPGDLAERIRDLETGTLAFSYPARDGVEGNADCFVIHRNESDDGGHVYTSGRWSDDETWPGDVHALLKVRRGRVRDIDFSVLRDGADRPGADLDLGEVEAEAAASWLLDLAKRQDGDAAEEALLGVVAARDVSPGAELASLARDRSRPSDLREAALFWMAVLAGDAAIATAQDLIDDEDEDLELRAHAVFALSQLDDDRAFPLLLDVARNHPHRELRRSAYIWLAQYDRPEVVNLFEDILVRQ